MSEENKALVRRIYEAVWNRQNPAEVANHFASDFLGHSTTKIQGPDDLLRRVGALFDSLQEGKFAIQDQVAEGDKVVTRWVAHGLQTGDLEGLPPTGKLVTITGIDLYRIAHGKIIEGWSNFNRIGLADLMPTGQEEEKSS